MRYGLNFFFSFKSSVMVHVVSRRPLMVEAQDRSRDIKCNIYGGRSVIGTGFIPCQYHFTDAPYSSSS